MSIDNLPSKEALQQVLHCLKALQKRNTQENIDYDLSNFNLTIEYARMLAIYEVVIISAVEVVLAALEGIDNERRENKRWGRQ